MVSLPLEKIQQIASKTWFRSLFVLLFIYKIIFNAYSADAILPRLVASFTNAELEIDTKTFSLFFGLETNAIALKTKGQFENEILFDAKRVALRYNLLSLLLLKLQISEVAIEKGTLFLHEKNGVWNYATIAKASKDKIEELETPTTEPTTEIKTYLPLLAEAHLNLDQFHLRYWKESEKSVLADIYDFNLRFDLKTNRFTSIPLNMQLLDQIDRLYLALNPDRSIPIAFESYDLNWKQTLPFGLLFDWKNDKENPIFLFSSNIGSDQIQLEYKKKPIQFGLSLDHHIEYEPDKDILTFKRFLLKVLGDEWLSLGGNLSKLLTKEPAVEITVLKSEIHLTPVNQLLRQLEGIIPSLTVNGDLSLEGTAIKGNWNDAKVNLRLLGSNLLFARPNSRKHFLKSADIDVKSNLNLGTEEEKSAKHPIPFLNSFDISKLSLVYNDTIVDLNGSFEKNKNLSLALDLQNLNLSDYTNMVGGKTKAKINVSASDFSYLPVHLDILIDGFRYAIDRSRSPYSRLNLSGNADLIFEKPFGLSSIKIPDLILMQKTLAGGKAVGIDLTGSLELGRDHTNIKTSKLIVSLNLSNLLQTLPLVLKEKVAPLQNTLGNDPSLNIKSDIGLYSGEQKFKLDLTGIIPGLELKDLNLTVDAVVSKNKDKAIQINKVKLYAYQKIFSVDLTGLLTQKSDSDRAPLGPYFGNLDTKISLVSKEKRYLLKGISFMGDLNLTANIRDFNINGSLNSNHSHLYQTNQKCPGSECRMFLMEDLQANIPFHHNLAWKKNDSLIVGDKSLFIKTYGRTAEPNLKISQIIGTHPSIADLPFEYVKKQGTNPGFSARIDYRENFATIEDLRAYSLDGLVLGKNLVFNVGTGDPSFMEFRGNIQIRDIDLKQLMAPKTRDKIEDGKIKADLNVSIRDLTEPVANMDLFFYIFQIGSDFGKSALNVISQQNLLIDRIADSYSVKKIDISLSKGLVYADVFFRRSILSVFVNLEDSKISQQRMPLANFLKRAQSEIQSYQ